ncbi:MAG: type II CAAX endopeptidase family protein [Acidobacteriota bacterium]
MQTSQSILFNGLGRLRSGWRATIFVVAFILVSAVLSLAAYGILLAIGVRPERGGPAFLILNGILALGPALLIGGLCGRFLEGLPYRALGASLTKRWLSHFLLGCIAGAATLSFGVAIAAAFGGLKFNYDADAGTTAIVTSLAMSFLVFAVAAAFEEALFRGYVLQTFSRAGLAWLAILLTSIFFGAVHLGNPGATVFSTINTILAGIWFSIAYLKTRDLWFVWGMHLMWNWMQGSFFGIEVSGLTSISTSPFLKEIDKGPAWLTGTTYGIEAGIVSTIALILSTLVIHFLPIARPDHEMLALTSEPAPEVAIIESGNEVN